MNDKHNQTAEPRPLVTGKELVLAALFFLVFAWLISWKFALVIMISLLIHEFGHGWALKRHGCGIRGFYFVPFLGLVVAPLEPWKTRWSETVIALMGPAWGFALGLVCLSLYFLTGEPLFAGLAMFNGYLNLFNLMPVNPVDGGRVAKSLAFSISPQAGLIVLVAGLCLTAWLGLYLSPIIVIFVGFAGYMDLKNEIRVQRQQRDRERVTALFAEKLGVEANAAAVTQALQRRFNDINDGLVDWSGLLADDDADLRRKMIRHGFSPHDILKLAWTVTAVDAIEPHPPLLVGKPVYATSEQELWAIPDGEGVAQTPLGKFLAARPLPAMTRRELAFGFAAYVALAAALLALLAVSATIMSFTELLKALG